MRTKPKFLIIGIFTLGAATGTANAQDVLTGDTRLACQAIMCLSTGSPPNECTPPLKRYFDIRKRRFSSTLKARRDFLSLCPSASSTPEMTSLVKAISNGAGRCDAPALNSALHFSTPGDGGREYISNRMPAHCAVYAQHEYTDLGATLPLYVGAPFEGGRWVSAAEYAMAAREYSTQRVQPRQHGGDN